MPTPSASYAITMRLHLDIEDHGAIGRVTTTIADEGRELFVEGPGGDAWVRPPPHRWAGCAHPA